MIALDTSAVICLAEKIEPAYSAIDRLIAAADNRSIVSTIAMTESLIFPIRRGNAGLRQLYTEYFGTVDLRLQPVTRAIALLAAELNAAIKLKAADAIHLATAIDAGAAAFITTVFDDFSPCVGRFPIRIELVQRYPHQQPPPQ